MEVTINGEVYKKKVRRPMSMRLASVLLVSGCLGLSGGNDDMEWVVSEYERVLNKESKLSRSGRDGVVWLFESNFVKM